MLQKIQKHVQRDFHMQYFGLIFNIIKIVTNRKNWREKGKLEEKKTKKWEKEREVEQEELE
jgi:hypothetical protein